MGLTWGVNFISGSTRQTLKKPHCIQKTVDNTKTTLLAFKRVKCKCDYYQHPGLVVRDSEQQSQDMDKPQV